MKDKNAEICFTPIVKNKVLVNPQQHKEGQYKAIVENSVHAFFLSVMDGPVIETNYAATVIFGYTADEFRTLKRWDFIDHTDPNLQLALLQREKTGFAITEATGIKKNGERFPIEITSTVFKDINGEGRTSTMVSDISLRKKAEAAMRLSNERYDLVVKATNDLVWDWNLVTGQIYRSGNNLADVYGHSSNEAIKNIQDWSDFIHPLDKEKIKTQIDYYIHSAAETAFNFEYRFMRENGAYVFINDRGYILRDEQGKATRMIGAARDITEQKNAALALAESEHHLRVIVQTNPECIKLLSKEGIILEMNPAGLALVGAGHADQVIGKNVLELVLPAYHDAFNQSIKDVFNGKSVKLHFEIRGLKGKQLFMETHCVPLKNGTGDVISLLSVTRDITESKNAQAELLASEERYRNLFNNSPSNIIIWDLDDYHIIEVNETAIGLYGYSRKEFLQKTVLDIRLPEENKKVALLVKEAAKKNDFKKSIICETFTKNGKRLFMDITAYKILYKGKHVMLTQGNDITEKIRLENSLHSEREIRHQQITEAVITGQEKERTALGEELHDNINQILASAKLYMECAMKDTKPRMDLMTDSKLLLEKAMTEIRNLSKALLPPSLGEVGLLQALHEMVDTNKEVNDLVIKIEWKNTSENEISSKLKLTIFRIIQEQLNNVIKHAGAKKLIIRIKKEEQKLTVSIKDNGIGFNTSLKKNGVGLRNIISRAQVNDGSVSIISQPGQGCELVVTFRINEEDEQLAVAV